MAVLIESALGNVVIDLLIDDEGLETLCRNFLELCASGAYRGCLLYNVQPRCLAQTGDPRGDGTGGAAMKDFCLPDSRFMVWEGKRRKHDAVGLVSMTSMGKVSGGRGEKYGYGSQFFFTLRGDDLEHLDQGGHCVIGQVAEGMDILEKMNALYLDEKGRPWQDIRLAGTHILYNPYTNDQDETQDQSNNYILAPPAEEMVTQRVPHGTTPEDEFKGMDEATRQRIEAEKKAKSQAQVLEMIGDLPHADVEVPKNELFIAKLNKVTEDRDLEIIFSRFGKIKSCDIVRDWKTGDSLNFAFIAFESEAACVEAYKKMNNVLVDDSRIKVDFSQSVAKLWSRYTLQYKGSAARTQRETAKAAITSHYGPSSLSQAQKLAHDTPSSASSGTHNIQAQTVMRPHGRSAAKSSRSHFEAAYSDNTYRRSSHHQPRGSSRDSNFPHQSSSHRGHDDDDNEQKLERRRKKRRHDNDHRKRRSRSPQHH